MGESSYTTVSSKGVACGLSNWAFDLKMLMIFREHILKHLPF